MCEDKFKKITEDIKGLKGKALEKYYEQRKFYNSTHDASEPEMTVNPLLNPIKTDIDDIKKKDKSILNKSTHSGKYYYNALDVVNLVKELSSDEMQGRYFGCEKAQNLLIKEFSRLKLDKLIEFQNYAQCFECPLGFDVIQGKNIVGYVKSSKEYKEDYGIDQPCIVISAHFDHLGTKIDGSVFNGCDDNASGCAAVLAVAQHFQKVGSYSNIIIVLFDGEEEGFVGSKEFLTYMKNKWHSKNFKNVDDDTIKDDTTETKDETMKTDTTDSIVKNSTTDSIVRDNITDGIVKDNTTDTIKDDTTETKNDGDFHVRNFYLNINMDMLSHPYKDHLCVTGPEYYDCINQCLVDYIEKDKDNLRVCLKADDENVHLMSDHMSFYLEKIPFMFFGVDVHENYHETSDTFDKFNAQFFHSAVEAIIDFIAHADANPKQILENMSKTWRARDQSAKNCNYKLEDGLNLFGDNTESSEEEES